MYPLCAWTYSDLCSRLDTLINQCLYNEAAVACAQTIEQTIKRVIAQHMSQRRLGFLKDKNKLKLKSINLKKDRDKSLFLLQGLEDMKVAWKLLVSDKGALPTLDKIMEAVAGPNTWSILVCKKHVKVQVSKVKFTCKLGLFPLRHKLIHGTYSPRKEDIEALAKWGTETVKRLLDPVSGLYLYIGWNPQHRISPFRKRKTT